MQMAIRDRQLVSYITATEDVAQGLRLFRNQLPRLATSITRSISRLFALSAVLREIDIVERDEPLPLPVQDDLDLLLPSLRRTLDSALDMVVESRDRPYAVVWGEMDRQMESEEDMGLPERLDLYHAFLSLQADVLHGRRHPLNAGVLREDLFLLWDAQKVSVLREERRLIGSSAALPLRPGPSRSRSDRLDLVVPSSPVSSSESWSDYTRRPRLPRLPTAPDPPPTMPSSPTRTSTSSRTVQSTPTWNSSNTVVSSTIVHWCQNVFDRPIPANAFAREDRLTAASACLGSTDNEAIRHLRRDDFYSALELTFDDGQLHAAFYFRPGDSRARILLTTTDPRGKQSHYCALLTNLKIIREASTLQLCRAKGNGRYTLWARLNFTSYERMVLFYCTFVAMKHQDARPVSHPDLIENVELQGPRSSQGEAQDEVQEFGGIIQHDRMQHALRMYKDRSSGVVRLEASAHRGPMQDVPLWTAFLTKYATDPDHVCLERDGVVSLAAVRPPPYVFLGGYEPQRNEKREYILEFTTDEDAKDFVEIWSRVCRANR